MRSLLSQEETEELYGRNLAWQKIFEDLNLFEYDFKEEPKKINASVIKECTKGFKKTSEKETRIICKQDTRESRPQVFKERDLFILPTRNGEYVIVQGEGYIDIPEIHETFEIYKSKLDFELLTSRVGNSEMQHLDFAYASSLIRTFFKDDSLVLTIRGRKYTPKFSFFIDKQEIMVESVQTEVDAGFEGRDKIVLIEAKNSNQSNVIIRQLFYPFKQWSYYAQEKKVFPVFFCKEGSFFKIWQFEFKDPNNYNSIELVQSKQFKII